MKKDIFTNDFGIYAPVLASKDKTVIHQDTDEGYVDITFYPVLSGIFLTFNEVHSSHVPVFDMNDMQIFAVNYCIDGRCEFKLGDDRYNYVDNSLTNIGSETARDVFYYPSSYYRGFEIYILPNLIDDKTDKLLKTFSIDVKKLTEKYGKNICFVTPETLNEMWQRLYKLHREINIGLIRLKTLEIINYLCLSEAFAEKSAYYLTKAQATLAKNACDILTADLSRHIPVNDVAKKLGVSETSLKNYFYSVYGSNISKYLKEARMRHAAGLLTDTAMSISDIAKACGYVNQGRFAKLFKDFYGTKPMDYRRLARIK